MVLLISYDLNGHERPAAYEDVKQVITSNADSCIKPLYSQWFVETDDSPQVWSDRLKPVIDKDDRLLVLRVTRPYHGWLSKSHWEWLNSRM